MNLLTRGEELVLVAVWNLQDDAYCVPIRKFIIEATNQKWSLGSIYEALDRLEKKKYLESYLSEPLKSRGGRSKRIYKHTTEGLKAMIELKNVQNTLWNGITIPAIERRL
ncbi:PadR family transcriptional regulator [candidate division KSB1 bacterium]